MPSSTTKSSLFAYIWQWQIEEIHSEIYSWELGWDTVRVLALKPIISEMSSQLNLTWDTTIRILSGQPNSIFRRCL